MELTSRQREILEFVNAHVESHGYPPTVREIGQAVGLTSPSTVHAHLARLESAGLIRRDATKPRALEVIEGGRGRQRGQTASPAAAEVRNAIVLPLVGEVAAGSPVVAEDRIEDRMAIPDQLCDDGDFLLTIRGDSMVKAGILDGDYVVVRKQTNARDGEIVVALVGDEDATVKRFFREHGRVRLQPENDHMEPLYPDQVAIIGSVKAVLRRL
ncbi:MAG TPA: transcriptional repressor LexA [Gaiellales bacterium]|nr:transcriptional repressor LexA [Gaiellales bacterium]